MFSQREPTFGRTDACHDATTAATVSAVERILGCDLLTAVSHELRTPLTAVLGYVEMLMGEFSEPPDAGKQLQTLGLIRRCGRDLLELVNDLLDAAQVDAGRIKIRTEPYLPGDVVREVLMLFVLDARARRLGLTVVGLDALPHLAIGDPLRIKQILINLVGNSLKFTDRGSIVIEASAPTINGQEYLQFDVVDTGPGLAPEQLAKVFRPFETANDGLARTHGQGNGLGLAISRGLASLMVGKLEGTSVLGKGSRFTLSLPREVVIGPNAAEVSVDARIYLQPT